MPNRSTLELVMIVCNELLGFTHKYAMYVA